MKKFNKMQAVRMCSYLCTKCGTAFLTKARKMNNRAIIKLIILAAIMVMLETCVIIKLTNTNTNENELSK